MTKIRHQGKLAWTTTLALALALLSFPAPPAGALTKPGPAMPNLSLPDTNGQSYDLPEMIKGKVALVVYWSISCPHCRAQMPQLQVMAKRFEGNPFQFILINTDGQAMSQAVAAYSAEHSLPGPWLIDVGPKDTLPFADFFDIVATPGVLVFDKTGKLIQAQELQIDMGRVSQAIEGAF